MVYHTSNDVYDLNRPRLVPCRAFAYHFTKTDHGWVWINGYGVESKKIVSGISAVTEPVNVLSALVIAVRKRVKILVDRPRVLVTGATGKIGRQLVDELLVRGYRVRAVTSKPVGEVPACDSIEWCQLNFLESLNFDSLVRDCTAVLHLGAERWAAARMQRSNIDATRALAEASERFNVKFFCYTSTVSVYGSTRRRRVSEDSPVLTLDRDVRHEYWGDAALRSYGRTKLQGELAIKTVMRNVEYVIVRPSVVVDLEDLRGLDSWSRRSKRLGGARHAHYIYVLDVVDAILWLMERGLNRNQPMPSISVFNLSDDEAAFQTFSQFFNAAYEATGDRRWRVTPMPWPIEWLRMMVKFRRLSFRQPFARMFFAGDRLRQEGYTLRFGMRHAVDIFCKELSTAQKSRAQRRQD